MELLDFEKKELKQKIESCQKEEIISLIRKYRRVELKGDILGRIFEKLYVNDAGFSKAVLISDLEKIHHSFHTTNGGDWCRSKTSYLGKKYDIVREHLAGRIYSIKCDGPVRENYAKQNIRKDIYDAVISKKCAILNISTNIECDHKEGMKDDSRLNDLSSQRVSDFQPLCKTANDAKRSHCKKCIAKKKRFDAKLLGYKESFIYGDENTRSCVGCYWYDPKEFNKVISEDFVKKD